MAVKGLGLGDGWLGTLVGMGLSPDALRLQKPQTWGQWVRSQGMNMGISQSPLAANSSHLPSVSTQGSSSAIQSLLTLAPRQAGERRNLDQGGCGARGSL